MLIDIIPARSEAEWPSAGGAVYASAGVMGTLRERNDEQEVF